jgi:RNA polymerase sigma factor (sigma-70 family)
MDTTLSFGLQMSEQDRQITETVSRERNRLRNFIRRRVADTGDAEDILQDVLYEATLAYRLPEPIEQIGAWMYRVALNRITDLFRKKKPVLLDDVLSGADDDTSLEDLLPSADAGPEAAYARAVLLEELTLALDELPGEQRDVFIAHELEGRSFKELAAESGVSVNTLLSRKRYAVQQLRSRLQAIYDEFLFE